MWRRSGLLSLALLTGIVVMPGTGDAFAARARHRLGPPRHPVQHGVASFYGHREAGRKTASGAPLDPAGMTAASRTLPLGTKARVVNEDTGRSAQVTITDRGPYAKGRILDVTPKAAQVLGLAKADGVAPVAVKPVAEPTPPQ